jgi:putative colanic acid biosynthesis acetyltransferase WcaF
MGALSVEGLHDNILTAVEKGLVPRSYPLTRARVTWRNRLLRVLWNVVQATLYRCSPTLLHGWRCFLLRCFGATIPGHAYPYPKARIWAPWNLTLEPFSCLADEVDCYCVAPIRLGSHATVSQYSYLCAASHDYRDPTMPLVIAPIVIDTEAWVAADVFVGPGVRIGEGAVVGARSTVVNDVEPWIVVAGSPALRRGTRDNFKRGDSPGR